MRPILLIITLLVVCCLGLLGLFFLPTTINPFNLSEVDRNLLYSFRLPALLTATACGVALAVSGFILQQLFKNTLAGPYILGVSSGASLFVAITVIVGSSLPTFLSHLSIPIAGFLGSLSVLILILSVSSRFGYGPILLLFGVILGQLTGALQSLLSYIANPSDLKNFTLWSLGSFNSTLNLDVLIFCISTLIGIIWSLLLMPSLSVMVLGDDVARTLGVNTKSTSIQLLACTGLLTGIATAYCGPIAFVGMAIPNVVKLLFKTSNFKFLLFANAILGAGMAIVSLLIGSVEISGINVPVNVSTALLGGPFVIYILLKNKH